MKIMKDNIYDILLYYLSQDGIEIILMIANSAITSSLLCRSCKISNAFRWIFKNVKLRHDLLILRKKILYLE